MKPPSPPGIPQEIVDEVIDLCRRDKKTLLACSSISRAWVYRTRKYLFSTLTLTDKTLPLWCAVVVTPTLTTPSGEQTPSSPYASSRLFSHVTSLKLAPAHPSIIFEQLLLRAGTHFSAFVNLKTLTLSAISFVAFQHASLRACFGHFAETVQELKLSMCFLDEKILTFLKLFTHLEALELDRNAWTPTGLLTTDIPHTDPVLRGSFKVSNLANANIGLLDLFSAPRIEYHTITLGFNPSSTFGRLNILFEECRNHLETLVLTAADSTSPFDAGSAFDLSPCKKLVEIHARLNSPNFALIIPTLQTVSSHRFRKLTVLITPPIPEIKPDNWAKLDQEISALAKRVKATVGNGRLEVVICSYLTSLGGTQLSEIPGGALPVSSWNEHVSLRTEYLPIPVTR